MNRATKPRSPRSAKNPRLDVQKFRRGLERAVEPEARRVDSEGRQFIAELVDLICKGYERDGLDGARHVLDAFKESYDDDHM